MARGLTKRQESVLKFIIECIRDHGYPPTIAEIGAEFGITSTNGVNDHLLALERKGYIQRSSKARGIQVTEKGAVGLYQSEVGALPLLGRVAAGMPLLAEENVEGMVPAPRPLAERKAYSLRVTGDSMIEAGILDGDIILVDYERRPRRGDIVVALVEDEATVKRFFPNGDRVELRPENSEMQAMIFPARQVLIQGVVVGLQRTYA